MKLHPLHQEILHAIEKRSRITTQHSVLETYLGNTHPKYAISAPVMRRIAKDWMGLHKEMEVAEFTDLMTSLIRGKSFNEKVMAGILLGYTKPAQRKFDIRLFDNWLDELEGWAEIDALCTGKYALTEIPLNFKTWKPFLAELSKNTSIEKRRASLVFYTSPISHCDLDDMAMAALKNIDRLKAEKHILITKAISWLLRSMIRHHRGRVVEYLAAQSDSLPAIAVRETRVKLKTGRKG